MHTTRLLFRLAALSFACGLLAQPAVAGSASSAGSAASTSVGSVSTSLETSSNSSTGTRQVAQGAYTLVDMVAVAGKPEMLRLRLQGQGPDQTAEFSLLMPRETAERALLAAGQTVHAQIRSYGVAFSATELAAPFFLVLEDASYRDLDSRPVGV